ncbi:hypothetical protein PoB_004780400 [Plakobranchus ocellatus]|uniref:Uncharacterized protein n=1 Tax=Plakobranchus ocellatus TaxID=259542 RepID=A0AAV4BSE0_9GAST|nr:hypothetical protein PoB_004780400 [Plakobranchus ocellatus]
MKIAKSTTQAPIQLRSRSTSFIPGIIPSTSQRSSKDRQFLLHAATDECKICNHTSCDELTSIMTLRYSGRTNSSLLPVLSRHAAGGGDDDEDDDDDNDDGGGSGGGSGSGNEDGNNDDVEDDSGGGFCRGVVIMVVVVRMKASR